MDHRMKLIGFDLDGTLLTTEKKLTQYTKETLDEAIRRGIVVLPVTGRPLSGLPEALRNYAGMRYAVTSNGARVVKDGRTIHERLLPVEKARKILDIFEDYDTLREVYYDGQGYIQRDMLERAGEYLENPAMANYIASTRLPVESIRGKFEAENRALDKVQGIFARPEEKAEAWERILALGEVEAAASMKNNIEVNDGGVHKGKTLLWLAGQLGIRQEEVMAFGDGANDLQMIRSAGVGVAMANAIDTVLEAADIVAPSNDEDGVAKILRKYVLE